MQPASAPTSRKRHWAGHALSTLPILFLLFDGIVKVLQAPFVLEGTAKVGFPLGTVVPLGITLLVCTVLYAIPRTAVLGAILLTGYLGGAVATHVRLGDPLFSHTLFPTYVGAMVWGGLFLREARLRALLPFVSANP